MPEGDTLHKLAKALQPRLQGQAIRLTRLRGVPPRTPLPEGRVESVTAEGKHLLIRFTGEEGGAQVLRTHLGLWGAGTSTRRASPGASPPARPGSCFRPTTRCSCASTPGRWR